MLYDAGSDFLYRKIFVVLGIGRMSDIVCPLMGVVEMVENNYITRT